jgi:hypothetical protein
MHRRDRDELTAHPPGRPSMIVGFLMRPLEHVSHDRARLGWLPRSIGVTCRDGPLNVDIHPSSRSRGACQERERGLEYPSLEFPIARHSERMPKRELHTYGTRGQEPIGDVGHHRDEDCRDACTFDEACQHGHVLAAVWSGRCEHDAIGTFVAQLRDDLGSGRHPPVVESGALVAHDGDVSL